MRVREREREGEKERGDSDARKRVGEKSGNLTTASFDGFHYHCIVQNENCPPPSLHPLSLSHSHFRPASFSRSLSHSESHIHIWSRIRSSTHAFTHTHSLSLSFSLSVRLTAEADGHERLASVCFGWQQVAETIERNFYSNRTSPLQISSVIIQTRNEIKIVWKMFDLTFRWMIKM